ncbi:MAG: flagellar hook-length control protein FliK, partial [Nitrospirae bacterium]
HHAPPGRHRLELTLHPPELGRVEVEVVVSRQAVHAHLVAQSQAGRDALAHHLPALREQLAAHGFADPQVSVDLSGGGGRHGWRPPLPEPPPRPVPATSLPEVEAVAPASPRPRGERLLDRIV